MGAPKQATLNEWVNLEALAAYADRLRRVSAMIQARTWLDDPTEVEIAALATLAAAETGLREALELCGLSERCLHEEFRQRMYGAAPDPLLPQVAEVIAALSAADDVLTEG